MKQGRYCFFPALLPKPGPIPSSPPHCRIFVWFCCSFPISMWVYLPFSLHFQLRDYFSVWAIGKDLCGEKAKLPAYWSVTQLPGLPSHRLCKDPGLSHQQVSDLQTLLAELPVHSFK
jgi:hypothetical protein